MSSRRAKKKKDEDLHRSTLNVSFISDQDIQIINSLDSLFLQKKYFILELNELNEKAQSHLLTAKELERDFKLYYLWIRLRLDKLNTQIQEYLSRVLVIEALFKEHMSNPDPEYRKSGRN